MSSDHPDRCGSSFRCKIIEDEPLQTVQCAKRLHYIGLHVGIMLDDKRRAWWTRGTGGGPCWATTVEIAAELEGLQRIAITSELRDEVTNERLKAKATARTTAIEKGFTTGEACSECGSLSTTRNGMCLLCRDCGQTSGCS